MNRKVLITIHMYLAAFFAPAVLLVAVSGGLYLLGVSGDVAEKTIYSSSDATLDTQSTTLKADVAALLSRAGVQSYSFDYVKVKGDTLYTRPTSSDHYVIKLHAGGLDVIHASPSLQSRMMELHKGHGPRSLQDLSNSLCARSYLHYSQRSVAGSFSGPIAAHYAADRGHGRSDFCAFGDLG